ncbi:MAG TPA: RidA family protein [Pirellulales bacterium]|nr:RidA family protein [Pirellulales bacterium]
MSEREMKLESLGFPLDRVPKPAAIYEAVVVDGATVYASGAIPFDGDQQVSRGKVPSEVSVEDAQKAAALCAANILRAVRKKVGSLDRIDRAIRLTGYVNVDPDFTDPHVVINGASQLVIDVLGDDGRHARSAMGVAQLPLACCVEVEMILRLKS